MSEDATTRLGLPLLHAGQAQKEIDHNEALTLIDVAVQAAVLGIGGNAPPADPGVGDCWIVGPAPTGAWAGQARAIAGWTAGGWRFVAPRAGMQAWDAASGTVARFAAGEWRVGAIACATIEVAGMQVVGARRPAIADPAGGATIDAEARAAIAAMLAALRAHGLIAP